MRISPVAWIAGAALLAAGLVGATRHALPAPGPGARPADADPATTRPTAPVTRRDFTETRRWFGRVDSRVHVRLIALAAGRIAAVAVADGAAVEPNQVLFRLAGPAVAEQRATLAQQAAALTRRRSLAEDAVGRLQRAVAERLATQEALTAAQDTLADLQAQEGTVARRQQRLAEATALRAPVAAVFTGRTVTVGQDVQAGESLAELVDPSVLFIAATIFPTGPPAALQGRPARVVVPGAGVLGATVTAVLPGRTAEGAARLQLEGPSLRGALQPGQWVSGTVVTAQRTGVLAVPEAAVVYDAREQAIVFVAAAGGPRRVPITVGRTDAGWVEIRGGLDANDRVVTEGVYTLLHRNFGQLYTVED